MLLGLAAAPAPLAPARAAEPPLNAPIRKLIASGPLGKASVGVSIIEVSSGRILCNINDGRRLIPASNAKLVTTGAALLLLGETFEFATHVYARGRIGPGPALDGDLVVVAGGDPALTTDTLDALAAQVAKSVTAVTGGLVVDDGIFDRQYVHPAWPKDQLVRSYCAPVSAFALNQNRILVSVRPGPRAGEPARVSVDPPTRFVTVHNRCTTVAAGRAQAYIARRPAHDTIVVTGKLTPKSAGASARVPVADPARYAATVFKERLARAGVRVAGAVSLSDRRVDPKGMTRLASERHPLAPALRAANTHSENFYAEMLFKTLGRTRAVPATFQAGARAAAKALERAGIQPDSCTIDDGSGLSRRNQYSALQIACFLRFMAMSPRADTFIASLAVSGRSGTLRRRLAQAPYAGKVLAKTGTLRGASGLSGYVAAGGRRVAFSVLVNGARVRAAAARRLQDAVARLLVDRNR